MTPALAPGPRFDPAAPRWSPLQSLVPPAPASWHPVLFPCPPDKNCDRPRWHVLPAPESRNSSCAHASESACARPLLPAFADALEPDFARDVCLAFHRPYPTASRLPIAHRPPASMVPHSSATSSANKPSHTVACWCRSLITRFPPGSRDHDLSNFLARPRRSPSCELLLKSAYFCT